VNAVPLLYSLHSGNLYGTERMALATIEALGPEFEPVILAPDGPVHGEAKRLGMQSHILRSNKEFLTHARPWFGRSKRLVLFSTQVVHSVMASMLNLIWRRRLAHIHMVHGGTDEALSYGRKRHLNHFPVLLVAVSAFVRERLLAHGVAPGSVRVIENFLTADRVAAAPRRNPFREGGLREGIVISRLDPIKRVDLLFDALERHADEFRGVRVRLFGRGDDEAALKARAERSGLNVVFEGFSTEVDRALAASDMLIHLCGEEPFGLAVLEAMAARVPVVVPDTGGAGSLIEPGRTGLRFRAGDADSLAATLREAHTAAPARMNALTDAATEALNTRFSQRERGAEYRAVIEELLA
jgi:glycosyltransferase involved in cell wall biosynthesis